VSSANVEKGLRAAEGAKANLDDQDDEELDICIADLFSSKSSAGKPKSTSVLSAPSSLKEQSLPSYFDTDHESISTRSRSRTRSVTKSCGQTSSRMDAKSVASLGSGAQFICTLF
jgi:hypothetical protein